MTLPQTAAEYVAFQSAEAEKLRVRVVDDATAPNGLKTLAADSEGWKNAYLAALTDAGLLRPEDEPPAIRR